MSETENVQLSDAERTAVAEIVAQTLGSTVETKAKQVYKTLVSEQELSIGDELCPMWMRHTGRFLNAVKFAQEGSREQAVETAKSYFDARNGLNDTAKKYEEREAVRIIRESRLGKLQQMRIQSTLTDAAGQFLLPKPFLAEIFVTLEEFGVARRLFRGIPMSSKNLDLKDVASKPTIFWENENAKIRETTIEFGEKQLVAKKLAALLPWTLEFQEDEVFGFITLASQLFGEEIARAEDSAGFVGGGVSDTGNGGFTGMLNLVNATVYTLGSSVGSGKTSYADATADDYNRAIYSISQAKRRNARWFMHDSQQGNLERLKGEDGQYIYRSPASAGQPSTLWNYPIEWVDVMPSLDGEDQVGSRFVAFGDPSNMLFGNRRGVTFDVSREGTILGANAPASYSAFQQDGAILRVTERIGFETPLDANFVVIKTAAS